MLKWNRLRRTRLRVAMVWGDRVVQDDVFKAPQVVKVGERPGECDFVLSDRRLPPCYELFRPTPSGYVLRVTGAVIGQVFVGGRQVDLEQLHTAGVQGPVVGELELARGDRGVVCVGSVAFVFHFVGDGQGMPSLSLIRSVDRTMSAAVVTAMLLHGALLVAARLAPEDSGPMSDRRFPDRWVKLFVDKPTIKPPPLEERRASASAQAGPGETSDRSAPKRPRPKPQGVGDGPGVKGHALLDVLTAGLPGIAGLLTDQDEFRDRLHFATNGQGTHEVASGAGGWGLRGLPGGGKSSFGGKFGFGKLPGGADGGPGGGPARVKERHRVKVVGRVVHSRPSATGACDPDAVRRVVLARAAGVRYCYENQLIRQTDLAGKLTMTWRIEGNGRVSQVYVSDDHLGNRKVAQCVVRQVRRWRFPKPKNGGACLIQYPFVFSSGR